VIGVLCVQSATPDKYSPHDLQIFQALATYCGSALRRLRAQEALRHSEERFRTLFESAPIAISLHDAKGHFIEANRSYQKLLGYSAEELQKLGVVQVTCPEDVPEGRGLWGELVASTRERYAREKRLLRKDGTQVWIDAFTSAVRDANGRLLYVVSMVEDITERKRSQAAVQELAWIVENSDHAIFSNTLQGVISSWNKAAERIYGYTTQEVLGQPVSMLVPPDRIEELETVMKRLRAGAHMREFDTIHRRKDNTLVELSLTISPVLDPQGKLIAASALARDITQRKRLEQEVLQISSEERRNVGHELHDGLGQLLTGIALKVKALQCKLAKSASPCVFEVEEIVTLINGAIGQTRHLAHGLDPVEIEASGLVTALKSLAAEMRKVFNVECEIICNDEVLPVNAVTGFALYRITQEASHNATRHGLARKIKIELSSCSERLLL
jgi:PAS domain S-box-containing protein